MFGGNLIIIKKGNKMKFYVDTLSVQGVGMLIQNAALQAGYLWRNGDKYITFIYRYIYFDGTSLLHSDHLDPDDKEVYKELQIKETIQWFSDNPKGTVSEEFSIKDYSALRNENIKLKECNAALVKRTVELEKSLKKSTVFYNGLVDYINKLDNSK
jgi:hypothetical protein